MTSVLESLWAGLLALLPGGGPDAPPVYPGYVEGEYVYVAPDTPGRIVSIEVVEGEQVLAGEVLFTLDARLETESLAGALARVGAAGAALANLQTGARPGELAVTQAALAQAEADLELARLTLQRSQNLRARNNIADARVEADLAHANAAKARVGQLRAEMAARQMPARPAEITGAADILKAARAEARRLAILLAQRQVHSPVDGRVERLFYAPGEMSGAAPVLSILPGQGRIVVFFVPQARRAALARDTLLPVTCDGCPAGLTATFSRIASDPEFTPPIIFSREERARLVYRAEARLPRDSTLLPGQPVTVEAPE